MAPSSRMAPNRSSPQAFRPVDSKHNSQSVPKEVDPRPERTRTLLAQALALLLMRRSYAQIRVSDITRKAGVGRVTFYAHFESKDALLSAELALITQDLVVPTQDRPWVVDCTALFAHMHHAPDIYRALMAGEARLTAEHLVQQALEQRVLAIIAADATPDARALIPPALVARFVASTVLSLVGWSLEQPQPPDAAQLQTMFCTLVGQGLNNPAPATTTHHER